VSSVRSYVGTGKSLTLLESRIAIGAIGVVTEFLDFRHWRHHHRPTDTTPATAGLPNPDCASCVEQFNIAVGTPGEYQRVFHQDKLGRDVSYFTRIPKEDCAL